MKKSVVTMFVCFFATAQQVVSVDVEAVMYLDTEMPCLPKESEGLSGRIVICNKGNDDIKLLKSVVNPDDVVHSQLYLLPNISQEERTFYVGLESDFGRPTRTALKNSVDYCLQKNGWFIFLKKGEFFEVEFDGREIETAGLLLHASYARKRIPFKVELYLSPDTWIPVEVHPPIEIAYDAKYTQVTEQGDNNSTRVTRVQIGTNEFLWAKANPAMPSLRLADLHPDDVVVHSNKVITITQKNGKVRTIPEADIPRISAERAEEKRKARQLETKN